MSRAYRIRVRQSLQKVIRAEDHVRSRLELLPVLPAERMAEHLGNELESRGFQRLGNRAVRQEQGVTILVDLETGDVEVRSAETHDVDLRRDVEVVTYEEQSEKQREDVRRRREQELQQDLEREADEQQRQLRQVVTERLEGRLADVRQELDQAVNRATAAALKEKAAQLGQIKELTEDPQTGSLTIVVEV